MAQIENPIANYDNLKTDHLSIMKLPFKEGLPFLESFTKFASFLVRMSRMNTLQIKSFTT